MHVRSCLGVHRFGCVLLFLFGLPKTCVTAKRTSVNKLYTDCIYLIHMPVMYTAVCRSWSGRKNHSTVAALCELENYCKVSSTMTAYTDKNVLRCFFFMFC
ncbi:hypothetical protein ATANTOWER_002491 [Ataeniobius toweri]|uniref:Secreted protein n=1 Tax=Ataeniobius toweri TaxID=208326 RepID=A0ABU7ASS3_9TELE|nr:hypothetical protein [Ataeniobius toweri]